MAICPDFLALPSKEVDNIAAPFRLQPVTKPLLDKVTPPGVACNPPLSRPCKFCNVGHCYVINVILHNIYYDLQALYDDIRLYQCEYISYI